MWSLYSIIDLWLAFDKENVIAVHCLAGKGRTGMTIICTLLMQGFFNNIKYNENYRPDFVINNTKKDIIIEYFGLYYPNSSSNIVKQYVLKTNRKIEYFNSLDNIYFISIFPNDLKDNFKGLNEKVQEFRAQGCELF